MPLASSRARAVDYTVRDCSSEVRSLARKRIADIDIDATLMG
jgi:hypothetical protein